MWHLKSSTLLLTFVTEFLEKDQSRKYQIFPKKHPYIYMKDNNNGKECRSLVYFEIDSFI